MDRRNAAGMPGVPCLEHVERLAAAHLADDDPIGPEPQRRAHQVRHRDGADPVGADGTRAQRDDVRRGALELARVLDQDHPLVEIRSEEHTSELQSLMRISYAVFCLKKKRILTDLNTSYTSM